MQCCDTATSTCMEQSSHSVSLCPHLWNMVKHGMVKLFSQRATSAQAVGVARFHHELSSELLWARTWPAWPAWLQNTSHWECRDIRGRIWARIGGQWWWPQRPWNDVFYEHGHVLFSAGSTWRSVFPVLRFWSDPWNGSGDSAWHHPSRVAVQGRRYVAKESWAASLNISEYLWISLNISEYLWISLNISESVLLWWHGAISP